MSCITWGILCDRYAHNDPITQRCRSCRTPAQPSLLFGAIDTAVDAALAADPAPTAGVATEGATGVPKTDEATESDAFASVST